MSARERRSSGGGRSVASRTFRSPARLAGGCALLLVMAGCAASGYAGVSEPGGHVRFAVPGDWRPIGASALAAELKHTIGTGGAWTVAYEAGPRQRATDFLSFSIAQPFVLADYGVLTATTSREM